MGQLNARLARGYPLWDHPGTIASHSAPSEWTGLQSEESDRVSPSDLAPARQP